MNKYLTIGLIAVFVIILSWRECSHAADKKAQEESYEAVITFNDIEKGQLKNSLDLKVADSVIMAQNIMSEKVAKEQLKEELEGYKSITAYMKSEVITSIKSLEAKYTDLSKDQFEDITIKDGVYIHKDDVDRNFIRIPKTFTYSDEWMSLNGTVNKESTLIDSLGIFNKFDAIIGYKNQDKSFSWARKKVPVVELKSYNPNTSINYVNNVVVNNDKGKVGSILLSKPAMFIYGIACGKVFLN